jgi:uracil-DNA glycosylase
MLWKELDYWASGEWQVVSERLDDLKKKSVLWCPGRRNLFSVFRICPFDSVRVVIMGQDPYPNPALATGVAFSIPPSVPKDKYPPTLKNILKEYEDDLHYGPPVSGDLSPWCKSGVLLWNTIPSCEALRPTSHHWPEWEYLTREIIEKLDRKDIVFILLGRFAREYAKHITRSDVIETSHPSPLGAKYGFLGSRIFTTANGKLCEQGLDPINWRLP